MLCAATLLVLTVSVQDGDPLYAALDDMSAERIYADVETLVGFGTRNTFSDTTSDERGIGAARRWLQAEMARIAVANGGRMEVRTQRFTETVRRRANEHEAEFVNVYGFLPGLDVDPLGRTYVVSGHYDSIVANPFDAEADAPGADDDASGTAVVLELARVLSGLEFSANLVFLCVAGEEQGLIGAKHFAAKAEEQGWQIDAMVTNDIVGGIEGGNGVVDEHTIRCFSGGVGLHDPSRELARTAFDLSQRHIDDAHVELIFRLDRFGRGGDHIPFHEQGVPALRFTEANEHYDRQHKVVGVVDGVAYGDLPEHVSGPYMRRVARVNGALLGNLASAPPAPESIRVRGAMRYDTTLQWSESPGASGYQVLWRKTTAPAWEHASAITTDTALTLDGVIADGYFFGVRAVDALGRVSRTTVPRER